MRRYVIVGAGAVGATLAAQLHLADREVVVAARGAQLRALREYGLSYIRPSERHRLRLAVVGGPDETNLRPDDVLVFATKSQDTEEAVKQWAWRPVGIGGTHVPAADVLPAVMLQNGLDNERCALRRFSGVLGASVAAPATYLRPGEVISHGLVVGGMWIGRFPSGDDAEVERLASDFEDAGFVVQTVADITRWKAAKLLTNLVNTLAALYRPSELRDHVERMAVEEARAVFKAASVSVADPRTESGIDLSAVAGTEPGGESWQRTSWHGSSTRQSLTRGVPLETDFLNGEVVLLGRLHGVATPVNSALQRACAVAPNTGVEPGSLEDDDLRTLLGDLLPAAPRSTEGAVTE
ncbi:ketopantoate reductase family protein [Streptomyces sp. NPDC001840]